MLQEVLHLRSLMAVESAELRHMIRGYHVYLILWMPELGVVLTMKKDGNIHDRLCGVCLRAPSISLPVDIGGL